MNRLKFITILLCTIAININVYANSNVNDLKGLFVNDIQTKVVSENIDTQSYSKEYYRNQLKDENQKAYYDILKEIKPNDTLVKVDLVNPIKYTSASSNLKDSEISNIQQQIKQIYQPALDAVLIDYPQLFWLKLSTSASNEASSNTSFEIKRGNNGEWIIDSLDANLVTKFEDTLTKQAQLNSAVKNFAITGNSRYDKLKSIHDSLADYVEYDRSSEIPETSFEAVGALIDGVAVCSGYAKAFKLLCERENIPCVLVGGMGKTSTGMENHMWNYVQMDDGNWYAVDVTWDDQGEQIFYDYFLCGSNTVATNFDNQVFCATHVEEGDFSGYRTKVFEYPSISEFEY